MTIGLISVIDYAPPEFLLNPKGYVLETGRITQQGTGGFLLNDEHVKTAYLGV